MDRHMLHNKTYNTPSSPLTFDPMQTGRATANMQQYSPIGRQRSLLPQHNSPSRVPRRPYRIFRYDCVSPIFAGDWGLGNVVAVSSFNETPTNSIYILHAQPPQSYEFAYITEAKVAMPQTKVAWSPTGDMKLLSSGDALRLWQLDTTKNQLVPLSTLVKQSKSQPQSVPAPLTSFDWNKVSPHLAIVSSIDTTCSVWDLNAQSVSTQLIAHDQEVFDVAYLHRSQYQFVSAGCDGSVRLFDLRSLDNSTIVYESQPSTPMLRVASSPADPNVVTAFGQDQNSVVVIDIRATRNPVKMLDGHQAPLNSMAWLPNGSGYLATGADDCQVLLWDVARGCVVGSANEIQQVNSVFVSPDSNWLGSLSGKSVQAISTQRV